MADIVINPAIGKIDFFSVKGDNVTNTLKLTGNTLLFTGPLSASSISTGGGGTFVTSVQPTSNYLSKFTGNSTIANSLIYDNGTNVGIGTTTSAARLQINSTTSGATLLRTDGTSGTLFTVVDDLSDSLMSVNNSAGLPVLEVFADDRIVGGQYGTNDFVVINNKVGIGTNNPTAKLQVTSSVSTPSAAFLGGNVGIGTTSATQKLEVAGYAMAGEGVYRTSIYGSNGGAWIGFGDTSNTVSLGRIGAYGALFNINSINGDTSFQYNGSEKMRITTGGNVGIGTSSPSQLLHISSTTTAKLKITADTDNLDENDIGGIEISQDGGITTSYFGFDNTNQLILGVNSTTGPNIYIGTRTDGTSFVSSADAKVTILNGGNVGIGTTNPLSKLDVRGNLYVNYGSNGTGYIQSNGTDSDLQITTATNLTTLSNTGTSGALAFGAGNSERMRILSGGNIGIGTTSPADKLEVDGGVRLRSGNSLTLRNATNDSSAAIYNVGGSNGSIISFAVGPTPTMYVGSNVGIGTTNASAKLTLNGFFGFSGDFTKYIYMPDIYQGTGSIYMQAGYGSDLAGGAIRLYGHNATTYTGGDVEVGLSGKGNFLINSYIGGTRLVTVKVDGNVGIGTSSPAYKLDVNGAIGVGGLRFIDLSTNYFRIFEPAGNIAIYLGNAGDPSNYFDNTNHVFRNRGGSSVYALINNNGNLGIGTTTVPSPLTIYNNADVWHFRLGSAAGELRFGGATNNGAVIQSYTPAGVVRDLYIQRDGGKVGIGTNSPNSPLTIVGDGTPNGVSGVLRVADTGSSKWGSIGLPDVQSTTTAANNFYLIGRGAAYTDRVLSIHIPNTADYGSGAQPKFGVYSTGADLLASVEASTGNSYFKGNVGIGSATPAYKLDVNGGLNINGILSVAGVAVLNTANNANDMYANIRVIRNASSTITDGMYINYDSTGTTNAHLRFYANGGTERMRIDASSGNVGIGTTVPNQKLSIYPGTTGGIALQDSGGTTRSYFFIDNTNPTYSTGIRTTNYYIDFDSSGGAQNAIRFYTGTGGIGTGTERMRVTGTGNIGIGTSSPISKLNAYASGSNLSVLKIDGGNGTLFEVTDQLSGSLFSVNTIAGLPVMEAFSNNRVVMGKYNANDFVISGSRVGIGTVPNNSKLHIYADHVTNHSVVKIQTITSIASGGVPSLAFFDADGSRNTLVYVASDGTYLANEVAKPIIFSTNSTEKMRILSGGNVGIGTSSPSFKLSVQGIAQARGGVYVTQASPTNTLILDADNTSLHKIYTNSTVDLSLGTNSSTSQVYLQNGGNVGIGTTSPTAKLDVANGGLSVSGWSNNNSGTTGGVEIGWDGNWGIFQVYDRVNANYEPILINGSYTMFYVSGTERARLNTSGNLGIGTTSPNTLLHVQGTNPFVRINNASTGDQGIKISYNNSDTHGLHLLYNPNNAVSYIDNTYPISAGYVFGDIYFRQNVAGTMTTRMTIKADGGGNVGIGTTTPSGKLHVNSTTAGATLLRTDGTSGTLFSVVDDLSDSLMSVNNSAGLPVLEVFADDRIVGGQYGVNDFVVINNKVGIGTNNPSGKLHVSGSNATSIIDGLSIGRGSGNIVSNTVVGNGALLSNTAGTNNTAVGRNSLNVNTTGVGNTAVGVNTLLSNTTGAKNCAFGAGALVNNTSSKNNAFGYQALYSNFNGARNCAFGYKALYFNTTNNNSAFGYQALFTNTTGLNNSAFGYYSLKANITGNRNCAFGHRALRSNLYSDNTAFGYLSMSSNTVGYQNTAIGTNALQSNTNGGANVAVGYQALVANTIGENNVVMGWQCLNSNTTGSSNVAIGSRALLNNTTGSNNCVFGRYAGRDSTAGGNVIIGYFAGSTVTTGTNLTIIGYNAAASTNTVNNEITLGNSGVGTLRCQVTTITALSDFRDKTDINDIQLGLSFVEKLRPVTFKWDRREWYTDGNRDGSKKDSVIQAGFIAQELKALQEEEGVEFLKLVYESNPDKLEATPGNLMIPLIKAVQELSAKVKTLEAKVQILESK